MIVRFDPAREFRNFFGTDASNRTARTWAPDLAFDAVRRDGSLDLSFDLPGFRSEDVDISVDDGVLTVTASRTTDVEDGEHVRRGRWHGNVTRRLRLGDDVDTDAARATFENGVLSLSFPTKELPGAKRIEISAESSLSDAA